MWRRADRRSLASYSPDGSGWNLRDGLYDIVWYDEKQVPRSWSHLLESNIQDPDDDEEDGTEDNHMQDSKDSDSDDDSQF